MTDILEVCIGLILLYLVLSLACTTVNELIATLTVVRSAQRDQWQIDDAKYMVAPK